MRLRRGCRAAVGMGDRLLLVLLGGQESPGAEPVLDHESDHGAERTPLDAGELVHCLPDLAGRTEDDGVQALSVLGSHGNTV